MKCNKKKFTTRYRMIDADKGGSRPSSSCTSHVAERIKKNDNNDDYGGGKEKKKKECTCMHVRFAIII